MDSDDRNYEVGFRKPPIAGRFQPGRSGNPKGRPRGSKNAATLFHKACNEKVRVKGPNGHRYVTKYEAAVMQLSNKAASGDIKAIKEVMRLKQSMPELEFYNAPPFVINFVTPESGEPKYPLLDAGSCKPGSNARSDD